MTASTTGTTSTLLPHLRHHPQHHADAQRSWARSPRSYSWSCGHCPPTLQASPSGVFWSTTGRPESSSHRGRDRCCLTVYSWALGGGSIRRFLAL